MINAKIKSQNDFRSLRGKVIKMMTDNRTDIKYGKNDEFQNMQEKRKQSGKSESKFSRY
jgi:hypothetical protein